VHQTAAFFKHSPGRPAGGVGFCVATLKQRVKWYAAASQGSNLGKNTGSVLNENQHGDVWGGTGRRFDHALTETAGLDRAGEAKPLETGEIRQIQHVSLIQPHGSTNNLTMPLRGFSAPAMAGVQKAPLSRILPVRARRAAKVRNLGIAHREPARVEAAYAAASSDLGCKPCR